LFWILLNEEIGDVFGFEACVTAEFFQGDEFTFFLSQLFADAGEQFTGRAVPAACDVHYIFGIDDYPVGYRVHGYWIGETKMVCSAREVQPFLQGYFHY
jgi:hypothetical protein